jgi:hypothetical protein
MWSKELTGADTPVRSSTLATPAVAKAPLYRREEVAVVAKA